VLVLCPYCGSLSADARSCDQCGGYFDLLSRQRTQNGMGPWFIRDMGQPYRPGCSYETLRRMVARGRIRSDTVIRGPTTRQFWSFARNTPGVAHLMGCCHACHTRVEPSTPSCPNCNASFLVAGERQSLGLAPLHLLPGEADPSAIADAALGSAPAAPPQPADPASVNGQLATPVIHAGPKRKKSMVPALTIAVSILGTATIAAIVWLTDRAGDPGGLNPAPASARATPPMAQQPDPIEPAPAPALSPDYAEPDAQPVGQDIPPEPVSESPETPPEQPADTMPAAAQPLESLGREIAAATAEELRAMLRDWSADPETNADRLRAAETRLQQLELRARYAPARADAPFSAGAVSRSG
jgi:hypothetical protein